jgi:hypothetical protein
MRALGGAGSWEVTGGRREKKGREWPKSEVAVWLAGDAGTGSVLLSFSRFGAFRIHVRTTNGVRNTSFFSNWRSKFTPHCMIQME